MRGSRGISAAQRCPTGCRGRGGGPGLVGACLHCKQPVLPGEAERSCTARAGSRLSLKAALRPAAGGMLEVKRREQHKWRLCPAPHVRGGPRADGMQSGLRPAARSRVGMGLGCLKEGVPYPHSHEGAAPLPATSLGGCVCLSWCLEQEPLWASQVGRVPRSGFWSPVPVTLTLHPVLCLQCGSLSPAPSGPRGSAAALPRLPVDS